MPPAAPSSQQRPPGAAEAPTIARAVAALGGAALGDAVLDFLHTQAVFDSGLILLYQRRRRPKVLCEALAHPLRSNDATAYLGGAYLLDPFRVHAENLKAPEVVRLAEIAPEDFFSSEYFRSYYASSRLADEVNFLVPVAPSEVVAVCVGRSLSMPPFDDREMQRFRAWLPLVGALFCRHLALAGPAAGRDAREPEDREHHRLEARLSAFGAEVLTPREHEVVQHLLRGHAASDIAARLCMSVQTVRVHRRNIYEKLAISSLGELFGMAMQTVLSDDTPGPGPGSG